MKEGECPKGTGISDITGKIVKIRHATQADMGFIVEYLKKYQLDTEGLDYSQFVVATEDGNPVGFGRLKKTGKTYEIGSVVVIEERKDRGIDSLIIQHLIDSSPVNVVCVITDLADYFRKLGFVETREVPPELTGSLDKACKMGKQNTVLMVYKKE